MQSICVFFASVSFPELTAGKVSLLWQDVAPTTPFFNNLAPYGNNWQSNAESGSGVMHGIAPCVPLIWYNEYSILIANC